MSDILSSRTPPDANPEPSQKSKNELSTKIINCLKLITIVAKSSLSDAWLDCENASDLATVAFELKHIE